MLDSEVFSSNSSEDNDHVTHGSDFVDDACILYCERFMEFLIDLLSQLPTRRYGLSIAICSIFRSYFLFHYEIFSPGFMYSYVHLRSRMKLLTDLCYFIFIHYYGVEAGFRYSHCSTLLSFDAKSSIFVVYYV